MYTLISHGSLSSICGPTLRFLRYFGSILYEYREPVVSIRVIKTAGPSLAGSTVTEGVSGARAIAGVSGFDCTRANGGTNEAATVSILVGLVVVAGDEEMADIFA